MNTLATVLLSALPLAAGWVVHVWWLRGCLNTARRDPLTGLRTRDGFTHRATALLRDPRAVVVLADVDKFKHINDTYGHAAGDALLKATADRLAHHVGRSGVAGRLGGDEFFSELARAFRDQVTGRSVLRKPVWGRRTVANGAGVSFLPVLGHQDETRAAYDGVVDLYASMFANGLETHPFARNMIGTFAELVRGTGNLRVADVGCGPGHVTAMLHDLGLDAFGLDLSPAMVAHARRAHPALRFDEARMEALPVEDGALGGVLAHYSMIHTPPGELPALLAEQVRVLAPGGLLLVSFFGTEGPEPVRFDHKVTPAYSWPADRFAELLAEAGLVTFARLLHDPASERGFLDTHLLARRL